MKDNLYNPMPGKPDCGCGQPPVPPRCPPPCPPPVPPQCPPPCPPPEFPPFCPEDRPVMGKPCCPPPPPMPPVPSVVSGMDLYEAMNHLSDRVNVCIHNYNQVMAENYKALRNMQRAAEENGAYYGPGEVWVEEGYYPDESATYHIVHKACVDRRGEPIRMQLHLAYGNTTNSKIEQNIFSASKVEYADKMMVAIPKGDKGWYGKALWHGCPMPSADEPTLWTVGFTRAGVMRVYGNSVSVDQMLRDTVEDAMGVSGVLVMDGKVTDDSYRQYIPNAEQQTSRVCMGQNMATREVVILTVGNENDVNKKGLTSKACAEILRQYGCDIAVELCEGVGSGAMDKGSLMYVPDDTEEPTAYAYWFISRKCFYKNDYERELAELVQNYGACIWGGFLNKKAIAQVKSELEDEIQRAKDAEQQLQENIDAEAKAREDADNVLQSNIDAEARARADADKVLQGNIDAEAKARADADKVLQGNIDKEALARQNADATLQQNINKEAQARQAADAELQGNIDKETEARKAADTALGQRIDGLNTRLTAAEAEIVKINQLLTVLQQQMTSLDATVTELAKTISDIETSLNNLKQTVLTLVSRVDEISTTVNNIISGAQDLPYVKRAGDTMTGELHFNYQLSEPWEGLGGTISFGDSNAAKIVGGPGFDNEHYLRFLCDSSLFFDEDNKLIANINSTGLDMVNHPIRRVSDGSLPNEAATYRQVQAKVAKSGDTMSGDLKMSDASGTVKGSLSDIADGVALTAENGACVKVGAQAVTVCDNAGGTAQIKGVKDAAEDNDAVNLRQLNALKTEAEGAYVKKSGDTMTGDLGISAGKAPGTVHGQVVFASKFDGDVDGTAPKVGGTNLDGINTVKVSAGDGVVLSRHTSANVEKPYATELVIGSDTRIDLHKRTFDSNASDAGYTDTNLIVRGVNTPVEDNDAVNKGYVDGLLGLQYFDVDDGITWQGKTEPEPISGVMLNVGKTIMLVLDPSTWYPPEGSSPRGTLKLPRPSGWADTGLDPSGQNGFLCWRQASAGYLTANGSIFDFYVVPKATEAVVNPGLNIYLGLTAEANHTVDNSPVIFVPGYYRVTV